MKSTYVPGYGYTVRDARGRILGSSLTPAQNKALMSYQWASVVTASQILACISGR